MDIADLSFLIMLDVGKLELNKRSIFSKWTGPQNNHPSLFKRGFPSGSVVKNPPVNTGVAGDAGLISGSGRSLGGRNGSPLQYSCLEKFHGQGSQVGCSP